MPITVDLLQHQEPQRRQRSLLQRWIITSQKPNIKRSPTTTRQIKDRTLCIHRRRRHPITRTIHITIIRDSGNTRRISRTMTTGITTRPMRIKRSTIPIRACTHRLHTLVHTVGMRCIPRRPQPTIQSHLPFFLPHHIFRSALAIPQDLPLATLIRCCHCPLRQQHRQRSLNQSQFRRWNQLGRYRK